MSKFKVDDTVIVLKKESHPNASWLPTMDKHVGTTGRILEEHPNLPSIYKIKFDSGIECDWWFGDNILRHCTDFKKGYESFSGVDIQCKESSNDMYPHICPNCNAPAYIGFVNNVECSNNCNKEKS